MTGTLVLVATPPCHDYQVKDGTMRPHFGDALLSHQVDELL